MRCKLQRPGEPYTGEHRKWFTILRTPRAIGAWDIMQHHSCSHNIRRAAIGRVLEATVRPTARGLKLLRVNMRRLARRFPRTTPLPIESIPGFYVGRKRDAYLEELVRYNQGQELTNVHAMVKCFVKWEKLRFNPDKVNPDPRMIQFRDRFYGLIYATYVRAIEQSLKKFRFGGRGMPKGVVWTKGLTIRQKGELIRSKMARFDDCRAVSLDGSRHDKHYGYDLLKIEHIAYLSMIPEDKRLKWLLKQQYKNRVTSRSGLKMCHDKRISGEFSTSLGNGLGCVNMLITAAREVGLTSYDCIDDGDDVVLFYNATDQSKVMGLSEVYQTFGYSLTVVDETDELEGVEFCSHRPINLGSGLITMCRDPGKVLGTALAGSKYFGDAKQRAALVHTIGLGNSYLFKGIPILQAYAHALIRIADTHKVVDWKDLDQFKYKLGRELTGVKLNTQYMEVTDTARVSFYKAYGVGVFQQRRIEAFLSTWTFDMAAKERVTLPYDIEQWCWVGPRPHASEFNEFLRC